MIVQSVSAEERQQGVKGAIIGNARLMKPKVQAAEPVNQAVVMPDEKVDPLPF